MKPTPEKLISLYTTLKDILAPYEKHFNSIREMPGRYSLWNEKELVIDGRKRKEIYFGGLIIQSSYVGLYYMPVYASSQQKEYFSPELLKLLKGKSCFHITELNDSLISDLKKALDHGLAYYKSNGWID